jgi:hypothetical protein
MKKRLALAGLIVVMLVILLAAVSCGSKENTTTTAVPTETTAGPGPATGEPIKVGLVTSLTGSGAAPGQSIQRDQRAPD